MLSPNGESTSPHAQALTVLEGVQQILWAEDAQSILRHAAAVAYERLGFVAAAVYRVDPGGQRLELYPDVSPAGAILFPTPIQTPDTCLLGQQLRRRQTDLAQLESLAALAPSAEGRWLSAVLAVQGMELLVLVGILPEGGQAHAAEWLGVWRVVATCVAQALERAQFDEVRGRMVSSVSHELRTPLTSIRAFSEMLLDGDAGRLNARQRRYVERVADGAERLERLTSGLLKLSQLKLGRGEEELGLQAVAVRPLLEDMVLMMEPSTRAKRIRVTVDTPDDLPPLVTDPQRLQQAICNFVDNAVKYSPAGTEVRLRAFVDDGRMHLEVSDQGPGISPEDQVRVFEEFYRCPARVQETGEDGSGLGLAIVQRLAIVLDAEVRLRSVLGEGSVFSIAIPLREI